MALPYTSENHEFTIDFVKDAATITCKNSDQDQLFSNPITYNEFHEMVETAAIKGVKRIFFNSNYSIEVVRSTWASAAAKHGVKLTRISN